MPLFFLIVSRDIKKIRLVYTRKEKRISSGVIRSYYVRCCCSIKLIDSKNSQRFYHFDKHLLVTLAVEPHKSDSFGNFFIEIIADSR